MDKVRCVGGPMHGAELQISENVHWIIVPSATDCAPKESTSNFPPCTYERRLLRRADGWREWILLFVEGYYG